jgi:hypothetical protein
MGGDLYVRHSSGTLVDGYDRLTGIELLRFTDGTIVAPVTVGGWFTQFVGTITQIEETKAARWRQNSSRL